MALVWYGTNLCGMATKIYIYISRVFTSTTNGRTYAIFFIRKFFYTCFVKSLIPCINERFIIFLSDVRIIFARVSSDLVP